MKHKCVSSLELPHQHPGLSWGLQPTQPHGEQHSGDRDLPSCPADPCGSSMGSPAGTEGRECATRESRTSGLLLSKQDVGKAMPPPDNLLFRVKARHRNLEEEVEGAGQDSYYAWKLFKYVNIKGA